MVAQNDEDANVKELRGTVSEAAQVGDGFFARRDGIVSFSLLSREPNFEKVSAFAKKKLEALPEQPTVEKALAAKNVPAMRKSRSRSITSRSPWR